MRYVLIGSLIISAAASLHAQMGSAPSIIPSNESGELHSVHTDYLANEASQTNQRLFVISHRGSQDSYPKIELRRLQHLKIYFTAFTHKRFGNEDPVYAVGEPVKGEGRLEYYLGSTLRLVVYAKKNIVPNYTCCPDYIPPRKPRRTKSRS